MNTKQKKNQNNNAPSTDNNTTDNLVINTVETIDTAVNEDVKSTVETESHLDETKKDIADGSIESDVSLEQTSVSKTADPTAGFTLLIDNGKALKLSPKTQNHVFFQLGLKDEENTLHIRMSGNEGGGLHSKEWVAMDAIIAILDTQIGKPLKSTLLKSVFKGGSANNCGFMAAVLRSNEIGLLMQSEKSVFVHQLTKDYEDRKMTLLAHLK